MWEIMDTSLTLAIGTCDLAWMLAKPCWLKLERSMFGMSLVDQVKEMKQFCSSAIKHT